MKKKLHNWGIYPENFTEFIEFSEYEDICAFISNNKNLIARGNGRCYGDASHAKYTISTLKLNNILEFNPDDGVINCQSGVLLDDLLLKVLPHGYFLPVTPGTKYITIGGALSSDIHGKNHHIDGVFSDHVISFKLANICGEIITVFPNSELFNQTAGGMGITGIILEIKFKLLKIETSYIKQNSFRAANLTEIFNLFEEHKNAPYSVAWIDCLAKGKNIGKSVLMVGDHLSSSELKIENKLIPHKKPFLNIPFNFPNWILNPVSVKLFNLLFYYKPSSVGSSLVHYDQFFYPLDKINNWNRIYGKDGFVQYQFVLPKSNSYQGILDILTIISKNNLGSFLAVLKLFGKSHENRYLHFPIEGYTLALDIKVSPKLWNILDQLDEIVNKYQGKIYLTKDARMSKRIFESLYPQRNLDNFKFISNQMLRLKSSKSHVFLILGANSDIAKVTALSYLAKFPNGYLILASRNVSDLKNFVELNKIEDKSEIMYFDACSKDQNGEFVSRLTEKPNWIMYSAGKLIDNEDGITSKIEWEDNVQVNFTGAVSILNELIDDNNPFLSRIIGLSSIAGLRGRNSNFIYGSTKAGFHQYLFGLRQRLKSRKILVQAITPGFVKTKMTANLSLNKLANTPDDIARSILKESRSFEVYPNLFWKLLSIVLKNAPEFIIKRL